MCHGTFKREQGLNSIHDCVFIGKIKVTFRKCVLYLDKVILEISPPSSGPANFAAGMTSGPKFCVVLSIMCCPALYITPPSGPAGRLFSWPVQWCDQMQSRQSENAWILSTLPPWHMLKLRHETSHHWTGHCRMVFH